MTTQQTVYTPLPVNDMVDDGVLEKLLPGTGNATAISKSAPHHRPWLVHLGIFSLYTVAFLAFSVHFLGQNQKSLEEVCALEQSMYCTHQ